MGCSIFHQRRKEAGARRRRWHREEAAQKGFKMVTHKVKPNEVQHVAGWNFDHVENPAPAVVQLLYTKDDCFVTLNSNGKLNHWKVVPWVPYEDPTPTGQAIAHPVNTWQPYPIMFNDVSGVNLRNVFPCVAVSRDGSHFLSASGGKVSMFSLVNYKVMKRFMPPPPAATVIAFHPQDKTVVVIGMEDGSIRIYDITADKVKDTLRTHRHRLTGLAFGSTRVNILVSSCADAQITVWSRDSWAMMKTIWIQLRGGHTRVQFHQDAARLLVSNELHIAIYDAFEMNRIHQWVPKDSLHARISNAVYSCDSQIVFCSFSDGNIGVFNADTLALRCCIALTAYLRENGNLLGAYPLVITAHPHRPNRFAVGLSDGSIEVLEPPESEEEWGAGSSGAGPSSKH